MLWLAFLIVPSYLVGSIPFGLLLARARGKDLRKIGSGNIGATNVGRALGKRWAYVCFILDCLKGLLPTLAAGLIARQYEPRPAILLLWLTVGIAAILGHIFSIYIRFTGGKGAATSLGVVLGLYPYFTLPGVITFTVWVVTLFAFRYVSLASIIAAAAFPISLALAVLLIDDWTFARLWPLLIVAAAMALLIVARHAENIKRLLEGSESKALQRH